MVRTDFEAFRKQAMAIVELHPIVTENRYTAEFARGGLTIEKVRHFTVQFSVFSHLFIEAQLRKCINAPDIASYRAGKEILMNELGVVFARSGSVDGGRFRFTAAHFEWLCAFGKTLGLRFEQLGKRCYATPPTLFFCDELARLYGAEDHSISEGASFAIEHWAGAGFWKQLIAGLSEFKTRSVPDLPLGFWTWHDQLEERHVAHTDDELAAAFRRAWFDEARFLSGAQQMLDAVQVFWKGLRGDLRQSLRSA